MDASISPFVSFIIPALNAERSLDVCLKSIFEVDFPQDRFEVTIVDNGSRDNTLNILKKYGVKYFVMPNLTIAALRNYGVQNSKGEIIAFVDSDCVIPKGWLKNAINIFSKDERNGIVGCSYGIPENACWIIRAWYLPQNTFLQEVNFIPSGNLLVRREVFNKVGGFDGKLITGEDYDFCERVRESGYSIISSGSVQAIHLDNTNSLGKFVKKEIWYGKGMLPSPERLLNKTVLLCHLFAGLCLTLIIAILFGLEHLLILSITLLALIPCGLAFYRNFSKAGVRETKYFFYLLPIYFTYFLGRSISLVWIYGRFLRSFVAKKRSSGGRRG
jgi:glycosyltransferase involved in cell wall biosynthesis